MSQDRPLRTVTTRDGYWYGREVARITSDPGPLVMLHGRLGGTDEWCVAREGETLRAVAMHTDEEDARTFLRAMAEADQVDPDDLAAAAQLWERVVGMRD